MFNANHYYCTARLTRDPEIKYSKAGKAIASFGVAVADPSQVNGEWKDNPIFWDCSAFDKQAERVADMQKGQQVFVEGRFKTDSWEKDGQKFSKIRLVVFSIKPIERAQKANSGDSAPVRRASDGLDFGTGSDNDDVPF